MIYYQRPNTFNQNNLPPKKQERSTTLEIKVAASSEPLALSHQ